MHIKQRLMAKDPKYRQMSKQEVGRMLRSRDIYGMGKKESLNERMKWLKTGLTRSRV